MSPITQLHLEAAERQLTALSEQVAGTGSIADYDRLCEALDAYEAWSTTGPQHMALYDALRSAAYRCGAPTGEPVLAFAKRRRETYRATVTGAVAHLNAVITSLEVAS